MTDNRNQQLKIIALGNSFSTDATVYLHEIAKAGGVDLKVANLYIGACSFERHWNNAISGEKSYLYELNGVSTEEYVSIKEALEMDTWDYITLQQVSSLSVNYKTYQPYLEYLSNYIKKIVPDAEQVIHQTWAYEEDSERLTEELGYKNQRDMFLELKIAYDKASKELGGLRIIPSGQIFQDILKQGFDKLHRDTFHASIPEGRYILSAIWYEFFTGENIKEDSYCPEGMKEVELNRLKQMYLSCETRGVFQKYRNIWGIN